jgi:hypothetical protein
MNSESGCQFGDSFLVFQGSQSYLGLELGSVTIALFAHVRSFPFGLTQSLSYCPVFGDHRPISESQRNNNSMDFEWSYHSTMISFHHQTLTQSVKSIAVD